MTDDLVKIIRWYTAHNERIMPQHAKAAADRIEKLEKYQSIHAQCDKVSLELEAKLAKQLGVAHKRIEKLEAGEEEWNSICNRYAARIEKLEAALRSIAANACCDSCREAALVARKALEGKE